MACVVKRRGKWVLDFRDRTGRRYRRSFPQRRDAELALVDIRRALQEGEQPHGKGGV